MRCRARPVAARPPSWVLHRLRGCRRARDGPKASAVGPPSPELIRPPRRSRRSASSAAIGRSTWNIRPQTVLPEGRGFFNPDRNARRQGVARLPAEPHVPGHVPGRRRAGTPPLEVSRRRGSGLSRVASQALPRQAPSQTAPSDPRAANGSCVRRDRHPIPRAIPTLSAMRAPSTAESSCASDASRCLVCSTWNTVAASGSGWRAGRTGRHARIAHRTRGVPGGRPRAS